MCEHVDLIQAVSGALRSRRVVVGPSARHRIAVECEPVLFTERVEDDRVRGRRDRGRSRAFRRGETGRGSAVRDVEHDDVRVARGCERQRDGRKSRRRVVHREGRRAVRYGTDGTITVRGRRGSFRPDDDQRLIAGSDRARERTRQRRHARIRVARLRLSYARRARNVRYDFRRRDIASRRIDRRDVRTSARRFRDECRYGRRRTCRKRRDRCESDARGRAPTFERTAEKPTPKKLAHKRDNDFLVSGPENSCAWPECRRNESTGRHARIVSDAMRETCDACRACYMIFTEFLRQLGQRLSMLARERRDHAGVRVAYRSSEQAKRASEDTLPYRSLWCRNKTFVFASRCVDARCPGVRRVARNARQGLAPGRAENLTGRDVLRGCSSVGRAPALQVGCRRFETVHLHNVRSPLAAGFSFSRQALAARRKNGSIFSATASQFSRLATAERAPSESDRRRG